MKTTLEFSIKFSIDPAEPIKEGEFATLQRCIGIIQGVKEINGKFVSDGQMFKLKQLERDIISGINVGTAEERKQKKKKLAQDALAQAKTKAAAARLLNVSVRTIQNWLDDNTGLY